MKNKNRTSSKKQQKHISKKKLDEKDLTEVNGGILYIPSVPTTHSMVADPEKK